jgi:type I restriction enzyme R subunit
VQARSFAHLLEAAMRRYQNRAIETAAGHRGADRAGAGDAGGRPARRAPRPHRDELAFYDALGVNDSAVQVLGDAALAAIAQELARVLRNSVTIDWTLRENVRARLRVLVKRILRRYGYPPDLQEKATQTVLEQAEALAREWAAS